MWSWRRSNKPDQKAMLLENLLTRLPEKPVVSGQRHGGLRLSEPDQDRKNGGHVYLCGDGAQAM
ncbi:hypothetical protein [Agathobaculum butyriciproducens]|uniref:hypothetical protein n=1 Tax=Agathobaculum butyriciproducens TaxID=1628085 RepID=UPI0036D3E6D8